MLHVYYGEGKGKTTAALGLALRMAGSSQSVLICRFLKDNMSSEVKILEEIDQINIFPCKELKGFYTNRNDFEKAEIIDSMRANISAISEEVRRNNYKMIVLDEILWLVEFEIISCEELIKFIADLGDAEIVVTGGIASDEIIKMGDYVTRMENIANPYQKKVEPRLGIEF